MWGGGVPSPLGEGSGEGAQPPPRNFFDFFISENGEVWCILGNASALYVARPTAQESEAEDEGRARKSPGEGRHSALIGERAVHQILYFHLC